LLSAQQKAQEEKRGVWSKENYVAQMKNGYYRYNEVE
jgi:endonuclease YncB( thermonuclease family)